MSRSDVRTRVTYAAPVADVAALASRAEAALASGEEEPAIDALNRELAANPRAAVLWHWLGLLLRSVDRHDEAATALARAAELKPEDPQIAHARARVALESGVTATKLFAEAHRLAPNDGDVLLGRAAARAADGEQATAIAELDALTRENPGWYVGHEKLAGLRWASGDREAATHSIERALATAPHDAILWRILLGVLGNARIPERIIETAARARAAVGDDPGVLARAADAYSAVGDEAEASRRYGLLADLSGSPTAIAHARHLIRYHHFAEAERIIEPLLAGPEAATAWPYQALLWRLRDDSRWHWLEGDPALVQTFGLEIALDSLAECLRALHDRSGEQLDQSVRGGTQTDGPLLSRRDPAIIDLRAALVRATETFVARLPPVDPRHPTLAVRRDAPVRFAGSWSVKLGGRGHHSNHVHPQGWLSSAFYVDLPDAAAPAGWLTLGVPDSDLGLDLPPIRIIEPKPGSLVLFPSTMWHGTAPFDHGERLTVAFDVAWPPGGRT